MNNFMSRDDTSRSPICECGEFLKLQYILGNTKRKYKSSYISCQKCFDDINSRFYHCTKGLIHFYLASNSLI